LYPEQITKAYQQTQPSRDLDPFGGGIYGNSNVPSPQSPYGASPSAQQANYPSAQGSAHQLNNQFQAQQYQGGSQGQLNSSGSVQQMPQPNTPMPLYPKASYGSSMSLESTEGLANSFSHMGVGTPIMQPTNMPVLSLIGAPPAPHEVHLPPPSIRLSPQAACTSSPNSNCSSTFKRCTMNVIPQTAALLAKSRIPLALYIAPYRNPEPGEVRSPISFLQWHASRALFGFLRNFKDLYSITNSPNLCGFQRLRFQIPLKTPFIPIWLVYSLKFQSLIQVPLFDVVVAGPISTLMFNF
jgi:protein transport protein SEC24